MPRGTSSPDELAIAKNDTVACWPWNLSTVPTRTSSGSVSRSSAHVRVVRRDDDEVVVAERPLDTVLDVRRSDEALDLVAHRLRLLRRGLAVRLVRDGEEAHAVSRHDRARRGDLRRLQATLVERLRDVGVHLRPQPPRVLEEEPAVRPHGLVLAEQMAEHRRLRARRVRALRDLRQLVRVAEEHEVPRRGADGDRVGERELPALVHEERVHVLVELRAREEPGRPREQLELVVEHRVVRVGAVDEAVLVAPLPASLLPAAELVAGLERGLLEIVQELVDRLVAESAVTPTRRPACMSASAARAPLHVLPEPGGPCTKR